MTRYIIVFVMAVLFSAAHSQEEFGMSYNMGLPVGNSTEHIDQYSWRGFGLEGRWEVDLDYYLGFNASWNVFYDTESGTFQSETIKATGTQYKYVNAFPINFTAHKYFETSSLPGIPYLGVGVGPHWVEQRTDFGLMSFVDKAWHFGVSPEVGMIFWNPTSADVFISARWNYAFKTGSSDAYQYMGFNIGLLF